MVYIQFYVLKCRLAGNSMTFLLHENSQPQWIETVSSFPYIFSHDEVMTVLTGSRYTVARTPFTCLLLKCSTDAKKQIKYIMN